MKENQLVLFCYQKKFSENSFSNQIKWNEKELKYEKKKTINSSAEENGSRQARAIAMISKQKKEKKCVLYHLMSFDAIFRKKIKLFGKVRDALTRREKVMVVYIMNNS